MNKTNTRESLWFPKIGNQDHIKFRLFCLPFAGGNAQTYASWKDQFPVTVDVCPIQLPGRANRIMEESFSDINKLIDILKVEISSMLDCPFAFFGHSMGALISFKLAKELISNNQPPNHLFLSAARAPHLESRTPDYHNLSVEEFKKELKNLSGTPTEVLNHPELLDLLLPTLRADFKLVETYHIDNIDPVDIPISVYGGDDDFEVFESELFEWSKHTSSEFKGRIFTGNHFYFKDNLTKLLKSIKFDLQQYL